MSTEPIKCFLFIYFSCFNMALPSQALFWFRAARAVAATLSITAAAAASLAVAISRLQRQLPAALACVSVALALAFRYAHKWVGKFMHFEYDHQAME